MGNHWKIPGGYFKRISGGISGKISSGNLGDIIEEKKPGMIS